MSAILSLLFHGALLGTGATIIMDIWSMIRTQWLKKPSLDYALVGRWAVYLLHGRFCHNPTSRSPPVPSERIIGWTVHYLTGIFFGTLLLAIWGVNWISSPTLTPALIVGISSTAAPFLIMQPGMGAGIAASKTPSPASARIQSLITHTIFGLGLYISALVINMQNKIL